MAPCDGECHMQYTKVKPCRLRLALEGKGNKKMNYQRERLSVMIVSRMLQGSNREDV